MDFAQRKPNRLPGYDYGQKGVYFVTICTQNRLQTLSKIVVGDGSPIPQLTDFGNIVMRYINLLTEKYPSMDVDKSVIMPNHIHMLIKNMAKSGTGNPSPTLGTVVGWFKYQTTKQINAMLGTAGNRIWQRSFYDHVIRDEADYQKIWQYIDTNGCKWKEDCFYLSQ